MEDKVEEYYHKVNSIHKKDILKTKKENREIKKEENIDDGNKIHKKYFFNDFQWDIITSFIGITIAVGMTFLIVLLVRKIFD